MKLNNYKYSKTMPHWFFRIQHLRFGYRYHPNYDFCMCTKSLFQMHNQTMNVFTHLIPSLYFISQLLLLIAKKDEFS